MTGVEFKEKFEVLIDEVYSGYWDDPQLNIIVQTATNTVTTNLIKDFQSNDVDTARLLPLLNTATVSNPVSNNIDISPTSTQVTSCKQVFFIEPLFNSTQKTIRTTQVSYSDFGSVYDTGTVRYPNFLLTSGTINIYPKSPAVTSCTVYYAREPYYVDVSDNSDVIPYNDEMIELIIRETIAEATRSTREFPMSQISSQIVNSEIK